MLGTGIFHDFDGYPLGKGFINQNSKIRVRMLTRNIEQEIDNNFLKSRVSAAWEYRKTVMGSDLNCCRVIFGEADFLPGLTVDKYADVLVVECLAFGMEQFKLQIVEALVDVMAADATAIPVKTIQQYEQGLKSINKAQSEYVIRLARGLYCRPEQLLEP